MKDESTTLQEVLAVSQMRMRTIDCVKKETFGSLEEEVQACLKTIRNPYVDSLANAVRGAGKSPVGSHLSPLSKGKMFGVSPVRSS